MSDDTDYYNRRRAIYGIETARRKMYHATYIGPVEKLEGQHALVRDHDTDSALVLAQFDGFKVDGSQVLFLGGENLASGWHEFPRRSFTIERG